MTRKDYVLIAAALKAAKPVGVDHDMIWGTTCCSVADNLSNDNPRFRIDTFLKACGVE